MKVGGYNGAAVHFLILFAVGILAYSNTFDVPFQWDGKDLIQDDAFVKDLAYFLDPSKETSLAPLNRRYAGFLTFALNYRVHGLDVTGYHIFNLAVHILNALLVYALVMLTFRTPFLERSSLQPHVKYVALFSGLLFVSHPVQTEAVTYIFQRLASLCALFYMLSLISYVKSRLAGDGGGKHVFHALSIFFALAAMHTKEIAFTLPLVITLYEFFFLDGKVKIRLLRLAPLLLASLIIPLRVLGSGMPTLESIGRIGYGGIPRWDYLLTQFRVVVTYIRLLFLPVNQNVYYDYPQYGSISAPPVFLSLLFLSTVFGFAVWLAHRSRRKPELRLVSFGVLWFFIALSVESSVIPIPMLIDEYRVYLPSAGAFLALAAWAFLCLEMLRGRMKKAVAASVVFMLPLVFSAATFARNTVWQTEISLWEDAARKSPRAVLPHYNLGCAYKCEGLNDKAFTEFKAALAIEPDLAEAHCNIGILYCLKDAYDKAIEHFRVAIRTKPLLVQAHFNLGMAYFQTGALQDANGEFETVLRLTPGDREAGEYLKLIKKLQG